MPGFLARRGGLSDSCGWVVAAQAMLGIPQVRLYRFDLSWPAISNLNWIGDGKSGSVRPPRA